MSGCFIDNMRPITPGERLGWAAYLRLPAMHWRAARGMFRRALNGDLPSENLLQFRIESGIEDEAAMLSLESALTALEKERGHDG